MRKRWLPVLERMRRSKLITLTIPSSHDLSGRVDYEAKTFRRFLDTRLGPTNWPKFKKWSAWFLEGHLDEYESDVNKRGVRLRASKKSLNLFGRELSNFYRDNGRWPRVRDVIGQGFSSREVTYSVEHGWHLHRHLCVDSWFIPWHLLAVVWLWSGGGSVVDIRSLSRNHHGVREALKYVTKFWEIPDDKVYEVSSALKGLKKIWPLGGAKPEPIDHICPECEDSDCRVSTFRLAQTMRRWTGEDGRDRMRVLVYGAFDEEDSWATLVCVDGRWYEQGQPYLDSNSVCVSNERPRNGPDPPKQASPLDVKQYDMWLDNAFN